MSDDPFHSEPCGCGSGHNARNYRDDVLEYNGRRWRSACLARHLVAKSITFGGEEE